MTKQLYCLFASGAVYFFSFLVGCSPENKEPDIPIAEVTVAEAFPGLSFTRPVDIQVAGDGKIFVVEQRGVISMVSGVSENKTKSIFLDIASKVRDQGNEEGLLGLAVHPDFATNGFFFVNYTASNPQRTVVSRYQAVGSDLSQANASSELVLLEIEQPFSNHNGGQLAFGPDGYLYIATGDGGSSGDPRNNSQDLSNLLGAILRIDVNTSAGGRNYGIPADNPFADNTQGFREEIFAYGLRNPWRFSFDSETGELWTGDVGQNSLEEINLVEKGGNYGWRIMEGTSCFNPDSGCDQTGLEMPVYEYNRSQGDVAVTGGYIYRGSEIPQLRGNYIYGDFASGRIWALDVSDANNPTNRELTRVSFGISSFGLDSSNELFICGFDGKIHRLIQK